MRKCCSPWRRRLAGLASLVLLAFGLPILAAEHGLLEKRESLYNNTSFWRCRQRLHDVRPEQAHTPQQHEAFGSGGRSWLSTPIHDPRYGYPPKIERIAEIGLAEAGRCPISALHCRYRHPRDRARQGGGGAAKKYFRFPESARLRAVISDGRAFLLKDSEKWDIILIHAYRGPCVPSSADQGVLHAGEIAA